MSHILLHSSLTLTSSTQTHLMEREVEAQFQGQGAGNNIKWPRWDCSNGLSRLDLPNAPKCPFSPHLFTGCLPSPSVLYFMVKFRWWHGQFSVWVLSNPGHGVVITRSSAGLHSEITNNLVKERKKKSFNRVQFPSPWAEKAEWQMKFHSIAAYLEGPVRVQVTPEIILWELMTVKSTVYSFTLSVLL